MKNEAFNKFLQEKFEEILKTRVEAQKEYASEYNVFSNFIEDAVDLGITPWQSLHILIAKHQRTIKRFAAGKEVEGREPIEKRILDNIVYLFLLWGMVHEHKSPAKIEEIGIKNNPNLGQPYGSFSHRT